MNKEPVMKVGDPVMWSGSFGSAMGRETRVIHIERVLSGCKSGIEVDEIPWNLVHGRTVIVDLDNNHWAWGEQLRRIK